MRAVVAVLFSLPILFGCGSADVVESTSYPRSDGSIAFILDIDRSDGAFELRAVQPDKSKAVGTKISVEQCANGQLFWDGKDSVVFAYDYAEILYQSSGEEVGVDLSIETCTNGSVACTAVMTSGSYKPPILIGC